MEKLTQSQEEMLARYVDGGLNSDETKRLESDLKTSEAMREYVSILLLIRSSFSEGELETPSKNFTSIVMVKLDDYPAISPGMSIRNSVFLLVGVLLAVTLASILVAAGVFDNTSATLDLSNYQLPEKIINKSLPTISFNGKLVVDVIILLNLGLAWMVLDRAILKPYFQRRLRANM